MNTKVFSIGVAVLLARVVFGGTSGTSQIATSRAVVNFTELAAQQRRAPSFTKQTQRQSRPRLLPPTLAALTAAEPEPPRVPLLAAQSSTSTTTPPGPIPWSGLPSPVPTVSFVGLRDNLTAVPPDTMGAVGPNHVMTTLNSQVRIQDRAGKVLSTVDLDAFWSSLGLFSTFDPHVMYDPFRNRWIFTVAANDGLTSTAVLVGVSATSDPTGNWYLFSALMDPTGQVSVDYDLAGFNRDWIVVSVNLFSNSSGNFSHAAVVVFDKADLYANGNGAYTRMDDNTGQAFSMLPASTYDESVGTMYLVEDWNGSVGQLRIDTITGPIGSEVLEFGVAYPQTGNLWATYSNGVNIGKQMGASRGIDLGSSGMLSCQYRNGSLWLAQNVFLPYPSGKRGSAQWWEVAPTGTVRQFGLIDDPSGAVMFSYPSLAVNALNDVLVGYTRTSAGQYPSADYAFRYGNDPQNTLRSDTLLKAGEGPYVSLDSSGLNRWGDYSGTAVDPVNDLTLWTIQEFSGPVASDGTGQWGTWWGRIDPDPAAIPLLITRPANGMAFPAKPVITLTATQLDDQLTFNQVQFIADNVVIGTTTTAPYTITWNNAANGVHGVVAQATTTQGVQFTTALLNLTVGETNSPLGQWQGRVSGAQSGTVYLTFGDDFTVTGYGITLDSFGLFNVAGTWYLNSKHQTVATYYAAVQDAPYFSGNFTTKVQSGKSFQATVVPTSGSSSFSLKGTPAVAAANLSGAWSSQTTVGGSTVTETFQLTPAARLNLYNLTGQGPGYTVSGSAIVTAQGYLNIATTGGVTRSVGGQLNSSRTSGTLKGADTTGNKVTMKLQKQ